MTEKPQGEPSNKELVERLASDNADQREAATRALLVRGKKALPDLRQGLEHKNPVVRKRIADLIVDINWKVPPAELLRPTKVRLVVKDMPLVEVAKELTRQAGIHIELDDLDASWSRRKFTLSLEETTFWEALDQVCQVARVHFIKDKRGLLIDDGSAPAYPVAYSGGVRLCLLPHTEARQPGAFRLELLVEPRLPITTAHAPQAIKGRDAQGNAISAEEKKEQDKGEWISHTNPLRLVVPLRLKGNAVAGTMLAELKGTILCSGEGRQSACLVDLATPGNKPTLSRDGRLRMTLGELTQTGDGTQVVPFDIEAHPSFKHDADNDSFHLFDDGGNPIRTSQTRYEFKKDEQTNEWTVSGIGFFGPLAARATPRRLLFNSAWRVERLEVPFQFRAIRLP